MSKVTKGYAMVSSLIGFLSSKTTQFFLIIVITAFMYLGVMNTYAIEYDDFVNMRYSVSQGLQGDATACGYWGQDEGVNVFTSQCSGLGAALAAAGTTGLPGIYEGTDELVQDPNVSAFTKYGILGSIDNGVVALLYNPPSVDIPQHFANEWVPGYDVTDSGTYAAEDGYSFLSSLGIDSLWEKIRVLAYVAFVIVLIAAGFMIMFRQKIGGQVAITVFNTLPNVILGLVLVTFSFAIVGLFMNFGMLLINIIANILDPSGVDLLTIDNPFSLVSVLFKPGAWSGLNSPGTGSAVLAGVVPVIVGSIAVLMAGTAATAGTFLIPAGLVLGLIILIVIGLLVFASVKVYITLLKAYIGIILDTILGPLYITVGTIPGSADVRNDWWKRVLKNVLVFPIVFLFVNLGLYLLKTDINLNFPKGLMGGDFAQVTSDFTVVGWLLRGALTVVLFFVAAEAPLFISDFIKVNGGQGAAKAIEGTQKSISKIPIIGGLIS